MLEYQSIKGKKSQSTKESEYRSVNVLKYQSRKKPEHQRTKTLGHQAPNYQPTNPSNPSTASPTQRYPKRRKKMNTAQPIRNKQDLSRLKAYYKVVKPNSRNYLLIIIGLNTALRVSDIIQLKWQDVYDSHMDNWREHIHLAEQKTGKASVILLNNSVKSALQEYRRQLLDVGTSVPDQDFLFGSYGRGDAHITRIQAFRIIRRAAEACGIEGVISCHSLRKTFGYHAWKQGVPPVLLMNIYNHSSFQVTMRYLGIEQDDRDRIFQTIEL